MMNQEQGHRALVANAQQTLEVRFAETLRVSTLLPLNSHGCPIQRSIRPL